MSNFRNTAIESLLALLTSAAALYFATGLHPFWWLTWVAPIPVLLLAPRVSAARAFVVAFLAWAIAGLNLWGYFHNLLSTPIAVILLIIGLPSLAFAADVLLYRWLLRRSLWRAALVLPSFWVAGEFLTAINSPHSTAGNLGYTQMDFLPILQIASVTGIWSISFCLFLFAAAAAIFIGREGTADDRRKLAIAVGCFLGVVLVFGGWRLSRKPTASQFVTVGLVASDSRGNLLAEQPAEALSLLREYATEAQSLAAQGAGIVVVPEKVAVLRDSDLPEADVLLSSTATKAHVLIVVGVIHPTTGAKWNEARLYFPDGSIRTYAKHHMLPVYEGDLTEGTARTEWTEPSGKLGVAICKDLDFPQLGRDYGNDGTALLLVPAWDFDVDGWWHGRMAVLRGVESGFSIARSPKQGILAVSDDRGRILAERPSNSAPFSVLLTAVPVHHEATLYARLGNWFGWFNLALLAFVLLPSMARGGVHRRRDG